MSYLNRPGRWAAATAMVLMLTAPGLTQDAVDHLGVPGPIALSGTDYELAWSSQPTPNHTRQEYLPAGQAPETYGSMVLVEFIASDLTPVQMAAAQVEMLNQRKASDPLVNMSMLANEETGETLLDFIVSARDASGEYIVEWNGYRYAAVQNAAGESGGLLFGISHRAYGNAASQAFLQSLGTFKVTQISALAAAPLPELQGR